MLLLGGLFGSLLNFVYVSLGFNLKNNEFVWLMWIAIYILLFVFYRNKFQFSGWYKGERQRKLPKAITFVMLGCSVILFIITPFLG
jgi:accessory gene regulator protein AgrB